MLKRRINITLDQDVHEKAKYWLGREGKTLSEEIENFLKDYCESKNEQSFGAVSEPEVPYEKTSNTYDFHTAVSKLPIEKQLEVRQFVDFLNSKDKLASKISVSGIMPAGLWMSDDFDEPLEMFQEYMQ
jgi:hypothetical protein